MISIHRLQGDGKRVRHGPRHLVRQSIQVVNLRGLTGTGIGRTAPDQAVHDSVRHIPRRIEHQLDEYQHRLVRLQHSVGSWAGTQLKHRLEQLVAFKKIMLRCSNRDSPDFNKYRGNDWMKEPCRTCPEREKDFGGCRCQAYQMTGDAANADPVCSKSPHHAELHQRVQSIHDAETAGSIAPIVFRNMRNSKRIMAGDC